MSECLIGESTTDTNGNTVCKVHDTTAVWGETRENTGKLKSEIPAQSVPEAKIAKVITPAPSEEEAVFTTPEDVAQPETKKELTFEQKIEKSKFLI